MTGAGAVFLDLDGVLQMPSKRRASLHERLPALVEGLGHLERDSLVGTGFHSKALRYMETRGWDGPDADLILDDFVSFDILRSSLELVQSIALCGLYPCVASNQTDFRWRRLERAYSQFPFAHAVVSCEVGHTKPNSMFFRAMLRSTGHSADACLFVDDRIENIIGARSAGIPSFHFSRGSDPLRELSRVITGFS